jgi:hypothetical protein
MDELTKSAFSTEWLNANALQAVVTEEMLKVLVTQAMNVDIKAQHMGIAITPGMPPQPGAAQQQPVPSTPLPPQAAALAEPTAGGFSAPGVAFCPACLEPLQAGGLASRSTTPYAR